MTSILIIEDEAAISEPLSFLLEREGFKVRVADDGNRGLHDFAEHGADLVLLDLMLPGKPGTEVCRELRARSNVPIIMLTAKDSEIDVVVGLELGADDYVTKPYKSRELLARIRAVLRRERAQDSVVFDDSILGVGRIQIDTNRHLILIDSVAQSLPLKEYELLEYLITNEARVLTRGQLFERVWGANYYGDSKTLDVHIKRLRQRVEVDPARPAHIHTVRGVGYRYEQ